MLFGFASFLLTILHAGDKIFINGDTYDWKPSRTYTFKNPNAAGIKLHIDGRSVTSEFMPQDAKLETRMKEQHEFLMLNGKSVGMTFEKIFGLLTPTFENKGAYLDSQKDTKVFSTESVYENCLCTIAGRRLLSAEKTIALNLYMDIADENKVCAFWALGHSGEWNHPGGWLSGIEFKATKKSDMPTTFCIEGNLDFTKPHIDSLTIYGAQEVKLYGADGFNILKEAHEKLCKLMPSPAA